MTTYRLIEYMLDIFINTDVKLWMKIANGSRLSRSTPFVAENEDELYEKIKAGDIKFEGDEWASISESGKFHWFHCVQKRRTTNFLNVFVLLCTDCLLFSNLQ